jgi:thioredoxin 1
MANSNTKTFTDGNFQAEVLESRVPVLVDFWAEWCPPCKALGPTIDALANEFAGKVKVGKADLESNQKTAAQYGITMIPTVLVFKAGRQVKKITGLQGKNVFAAALAEAAA